MILLGDGIPDWAITLIIVAIFVMLIIKMSGVDPGSLLGTMRTTRRVRVADEPRDQLERLVNNHRKVAKDSKPPQLKNAVVVGDIDIPLHKYGTVRGLEPHDEGYIMYIVTSKTSWSKPHIIIRELCGDANRRNMFIECRGFTTDGAFRWAMPNKNSGISPTLAYLKSKALFDQIFGTQSYVDAQEDSAWAQASAIMPSVASRVAMAEVEVPGHLVEKAYYDEKQVTK